MKIRMVEERIGELLGPVDWTFDFEKHAGAYHREYFERSMKCLKEICAEPDAKWEVMDPYTQNWKELLAVGMYDGWPYWRPVPSVCSSTWLGGEWHDFTFLRQVRKKPPQLNQEREAG